MQNFIKILYLLFTIFEPSTKITHSHLFIPNLTLDKIFPRTKLFRPELNRKKKSSPNKKKLPQDYRIYSTHIYIYTKTSVSRHHDSQRNKISPSSPPDPVYQVSKLHELTYPLRLNPRQQRASLPPFLSPRFETLRNPPRTEIFRRTITRPALASRQPSTA